MAYTDVCGKKLQAKMGAKLNESAASHSPALLSSDQSFAKRQLEKMGWEEGTGLGKRRDGRKEHVKIKQRESELGLGREGEIAKAIGDVWWKNDVGETLARLQKLQQQKKRLKKIKRRKKEKKPKTKSKEAPTTTTEIKTFTDEELFEATGGARFGMRAQRRAEGKWKRTESGTRLTKLEEKAQAGMEWDGRGNAQALLENKNGSSKILPLSLDEERRKGCAKDKSQSKKVKCKMEALTEKCTVGHTGTSRAGRPNKKKQKKRGHGRGDVGDDSPKKKRCKKEASTKKE